MVIVDQDKVKPNSEAFFYLRRMSKTCARACIQIRDNDKTVVVSEQACPACINRCKQCPGSAVSVVKLPTCLNPSRRIHQYGPNAFGLFGLPVPRLGQVLGLVGTNGTGKSTALKILSGKLVPNRGNHEKEADWETIVRYFRGSSLQAYFQKVSDNHLKVAIKPQLEAGLVHRLGRKTVRELLQERDERNMMKQYVRDLNLSILLDRTIEQLSGGELQRVVTAATLCREADVYMFDEVTSFLDVKQRLQVTRLIRSLVHDHKSSNNSSSDLKYVIVVEHDLTVLDSMSDFVQCIYGQPGAYGVVTAPSTAKAGINQFLSGYIPAENMRFRDHDLSFKVSPSDCLVDCSETTVGANASGKRMSGWTAYPSLTHTTPENDDSEANTFVLHVQGGSYREGECLALMGENGTGKTTFMKILAGIKESSQTKESPAGTSVSYKKQGLDPKIRRFKGSVQELLENKINSALADHHFQMLVLKPLQVKSLLELPVSSLSGGELQKLSIILCLGVLANIYLVDEPSAALDCEQRIVAAKVMKRWVVHHLGRTLFLVEHDFIMTAAMADRVIVYTGIPGVECTACAPVSVANGFNQFLQAMNVTFRRDPTNYRPRMNKPGSRMDKLQKTKGDYYLLDVDQD